MQRASDSAAYLVLRPSCRQPRHQVQYARACIDCDSYHVPFPLAHTASTLETAPSSVIADPTSRCNLCGVRYCVIPLNQDWCPRERLNIADVSSGLLDNVETHVNLLFSTGAPYTLLSTLKDQLPCHTILVASLSDVAQSFAAVTQEGRSIGSTRGKQRGARDGAQRPAKSETYGIDILDGLHLTA